MVMAGQAWGITWYCITGLTRLPCDLCDCSLQAVMWQALLPQPWQTAPTSVLAMLTVRSLCLTVGPAGGCTYMHSSICPVTCNLLVQ
jgi:hypothetical protein